MKKLLVLVLTLLFVFSFTASVSADATASWDAGKGTAVVDGEKDSVYAGAQEIVMNAVSDVPSGMEADGSAASCWAVYDSEAVYFFIEVTDSALNDANANGWEKDSVEVRIDNKDKLIQAYAVSETFDNVSEAASEVKVLKTDKGYNVEMKVPYAAVEGSSMLFTSQVNCTAADGVRNSTLHTNDDLKDAWQNNDVFETLAFSSNEASADASAEASEDVPQTGVAPMELFYGIGALVSAVGVVSHKSKKR
jgi:hypothetical protein